MYVVFYVIFVFIIIIKCYKNVYELVYIFENGKIKFINFELCFGFFKIIFYIYYIIRCFYWFDFLWILKFFYEFFVGNIFILLEI